MWNTYLLLGLLSWFLVLTSMQTSIRMWRGDRTRIERLANVSAAWWPYGKWLLRVWLRQSMMLGPFSVCCAASLTVKGLQTAEVAFVGVTGQRLLIVFSGLGLVVMGLGAFVGLTGVPKRLVPPGLDEWLERWDKHRS